MYRGRPDSATYLTSFIHLLRVFLLLCFTGSRTLIKFLLEKGLKPDTLSKRQFTALHLAAYRVIQRLRFYTVLHSDTQYTTQYYTVLHSVIQCYTVRGSLQLSTWQLTG